PFAYPQCLQHIVIVVAVHAGGGKNPEVNSVPIQSSQVICDCGVCQRLVPSRVQHRHVERINMRMSIDQDRKSKRLNSSHVKITYAVFCLKKKKKQTI